MPRHIWIVLLWVVAAVLLLAMPGATGTVTVRCPGGPAATTYYYDLVGSDYLETICVNYIPGQPNTCHATIGNVPMGSYRLLENGVERARITVSGENSHILVNPTPDWPVMPPK